MTVEQPTYTDTLSEIKELETQLAQKRVDRDTLDRDIATLDQRLRGCLLRLRDKLDSRIGTLAPEEPPVAPTRRGKKRMFEGEAIPGVKLGKAPVIKGVVHEIVLLFTTQPRDTIVRTHEIVERLADKYDVEVGDSLSTTVSRYLNYICSKGIIKRISRGKYQWVGRPMDPNTASHVIDLSPPNTD